MNGYIIFYVFLFLQLQQEYTATTGCAIEDKLVEVLSNSRLRIFEAAKKKRHLATFFEGFDSHATCYRRGRWSRKW